VPTAVGIAALLIGVGIGASGGSEADEPKKQAARSATGETAADLDRRQAVLDEQAAKQADVQSSLEDAMSELDERDDALTAAEEKAEADTIEDDGNYAVGDDINAGTWKNADRGPDCYWSINGDPNGEDILSNANGGGPQTLTLEKGQFLELANGCGTWKRQK
jgi:multidrug efflux pump subunit AcrA (membrane-fusion protein)